MEGQEDLLTEEQNDFKIVFYPENAEDEDKTGATIKGNNARYKEAQDKISTMFTKKGAEYTVNKRKIKVLDNPKEKGCIKSEVEVTTAKGERGIVTLKFWAPGKKGATIQVSKTKGTTIKFCKTMTNKVLKYLLENITSKTKMSTEFKKAVLDTTLGKTAVKLNKIQEKKDVFKEKIASKGKQDLLCEACDFKSKSKITLKKHIEKQHNFEETTLEEELEFVERMGSEDAKSFIEEKSKCDLSNSEPSLNVSEKQKSQEELIKCENCKFESTTNNDMIKHKDLKHIEDIMLIGTKRESAMVKTASTKEPDRKKRHHKEKEAEEVIVERAKNMDKKVEKKAQQEKDDFNKSLKASFIKQAAEKDSIEEEKLIRKKEKKLEKKKQAKEKKSKEIEEINNACEYDENDYTEKEIKPNGACFMNCMAEHLHGDESLGPAMGEDVNDHVVDNWFLYEKKIEYPFQRHVGGSESIDFKKGEEKELLNFLKNHPRRGFVWRGCMDVQAASNKYNIDIKVIKVDNEGKKEVHEFKPDGDFEQKIEKKKDMVIINRNDNHFNLLVPKEPKELEAKDVTPDSDEEEEEEDTGVVVEDVGDNSDEEGDEGLVVKEVGEDERKHYEEEIKHLKDKIKKLNQVVKKYKEHKCTKANKNITDKEKDAKITEQEKDKIKQVKDFKKTEQEKDRRETDALVQVEANPMKRAQFNCNNCDMQAWTYPHLRKHIKLTGHQASARVEHICNNCNEKFSSYNQLMNHRRDVHDKKKPCRYFQINQCNFDNTTCWFSHGTENTHGKKSKETCRNCEDSFRTKSEIMKHNKQKHSETVKKCRKQESCEFDDQSCWFIHEKLDFQKDLRKHKRM